MSLSPPSSAFGMPGSLQRRLILAAAVCISLALAGAAVSIGFVLHRFVRGQLDGRLDARITALASEVRTGPDGNVSVRTDRDGPPFDRQLSGWYWEVRRGTTVIQSPSLDTFGIDLVKVGLDELRPPARLSRGRSWESRDGEAVVGSRWDVDRLRPVDRLRTDRSGEDVDDYRIGPVRQRVIVRVLTVQGGPGELPTVFAASAPENALYRPILEALRTLGICLVPIGVLLFAGVLLQVRLGLRPLRRVSEQLAEVRVGGRERLPLDQPVEVLPLVSEINGLLDQNAANLAHARGHVANLAHGLKTPLATLAMAFGETGASRDARLAVLVEDMDRRIRHHLRRARVAATGGTSRERVDLAGVVEDLVMVMGRINAATGIAFDIDVPAGFAVGCDRQDVEEMLGNLLENACRFCAGRVRVEAFRAYSSITILVEDDGPGLAREDREAVLQRGRRLDESGPGHGFGLPIAQELAELYGGKITLEASRLGGLEVRLTLPS